uniref:Uncharacterized protein n=1 Tax=Trichuris muris TaxID=70415 RepID=A0A5S6QWP6_TRIMR
MNPFRITELIKLCMEDGNHFKWNARKPCFPGFCGDIYGKFEKNAFKMELPNQNSKIFKRYVNNIFAILKKDTEGNLFKHLNGLFPGTISFTMEKEVQGQLPFLDVLVMREGKHLTTKIYRKLTHSDKIRGLQFQPLTQEST